MYKTDLWLKYSKDNTIQIITPSIIAIWITHCKISAHTHTHRPNQVNNNKKKYGLVIIILIRVNQNSCNHAFLQSFKSLKNGKKEKELYSVKFTHYTFINCYFEFNGAHRTQHTVQHKKSYHFNRLTSGFFSIQTFPTFYTRLCSVASWCDVWAVLKFDFGDTVRISNRVRQRQRQRP